MKIREAAHTLVEAWPAIRRLREEARPRRAAIKRLKAEPEIWSELKALTGKHLDYLVHTLLMGGSWLFIVMCNHEGLHDPGAIMTLVKASRAFTADQRAVLEVTTAEVDALLDDLGLGSAQWSDEVALLGYALMGDGSKFATFAHDRGLDPQRAIARFEALPHLDEYGRDVVRLTKSRIPVQ